MAAYLPAHGWFPTFLTQHISRLRNPQAEGQGYALPPEGFAVRRTNIIYPWDFLTLPDAFCGWLPFAVAGGLSVARARKVDCIYSIGPPMTSHVVGLWLHRLLRVPWVSDFHDPWLANPWRTLDRRWPLQSIENRLERAVFRSATHLVANTPEMVSLLQQASGRPPEDFTVVTGGYDANQVRAAAQLEAPAHEKLVLLHAGHFYGPRSPEPLLRALAHVAQDPAFTNRLELRLLGKPNPTIDRLASELGITELVHQVGLVSYRDTLRHLLASDLAIVVQPGTSIQVPAKLYDYLGCRVPVVALTVEGATARLMRETNAGPVVPPNDVDAISAALRTALTDPARLRAQMNGEAAAKYEIQSIVQRQADLLDEITSN